MEAIVVSRCMLDSPVGGPWEGHKAGVQGQMGFRRHSNWGHSHRCDDQPNTRHCHGHTLQGKERRVQFKTKVPVVLLLVSNRLGDPLMPLLWDSVFQHLVGGGIMPPDPLRIKLFKPGAKRGSESMGGAGRVRKQQVEHHLPTFHGLGRRRSGGWPCILLNKSGPLFSFPYPRGDVCASRIAEVRQRGAAKMEPNLIDVPSGLQGPVFMDQNIHHKHIALALWGDHSYGAAEGKTGGGQVLPGKLHRTLRGKVAVQFEGELPERNFRAQVTLHCFHVMEVEVMRGRRLVSMPDDGLDMLDCLGDGDAGDVNALGPFGAKHNLVGEALLNPTLW